VLTPNDLIDLVEVERRLLDFQQRYEQTAQPFEWKFTRTDLARHAATRRTRLWPSGMMEYVTELTSQST
jgi:hypothetical protein